MQKIFLIIFLQVSFKLVSQELYIYSESASNIPAKSVNFKLSDYYIPYDRVFDRSALRIIPELQIGVHKKLSLYTGVTFSDMHATGFKYESWFLYARYRFLSSDDVHKHFRMAFFVNGSKTNAPFHYDETMLTGDKTGIEAGVIATSLSNKLALSGTISHIQLLDASRFNDVTYLPKRVYQAMYYSLSVGYLLFPKEYSNYKQTNFNIYLHLLAQQSLDKHSYYIDLAPAMQLVITSNTRLNIGYRFQANANIQRMSKSSWLLSVERNFLNVFKKRKK